MAYLKAPETISRVSLSAIRTQDETITLSLSKVKKGRHEDGTDTF